MLGILIAAILLPQANPEAATPLWQTLRRGMSGEEAAIALRSISGVKTVTVKTARDGVPRLVISYTKEGVEVTEIRRNIETVFDKTGLVAVGLLSSSCNSLAHAKFDILRELLQEKYGNPVEQREKTTENVVIAIRVSYKGTPTRVVMRYEPLARPTEAYPTGNNITDLIVKIHNDGVRDAVNACPVDAGQKANLQVIYSSNTEASASDNADALLQSSKKATDKSKL